MTCHPRVQHSVDVLDVDEALRSVRRSQRHGRLEATIPNTDSFPLESDGDIEDMSELLYPPLPRRDHDGHRRDREERREPAGFQHYAGGRCCAAHGGRAAPRSRVADGLFNSLKRAGVRKTA